MSFTPAPEPAADLAARIRRKLQGQHFMHLIGADLTTIEPGRVQAELLLQRQHQQQRGYAHGGLVATLCDLAAGFAAVTLISEEQSLVTVELNVKYLRPGLGERLVATGWVLKPGRRLHFCEAEVRAFGESSPAEGLLIAKASATMAVAESSR